MNIGDLLNVVSGQGARLGEAGYTPDADVNSDGQVDMTADYLEVLAQMNSVPISNGLSTIGNVVGYAGYLYEPATGLYLARHRWYDPTTGRWTRRDPLGYVDGQNTYEYVRSTPLTGVDPYGLSACKDSCTERREVLPPVSLGVRSQGSFEDGLVSIPQNKINEHFDSLEDFNNWQRLVDFAKSAKGAAKAGQTVEEFLKDVLKGEIDSATRDRIKEELDWNPNLLAASKTGILALLEIDSKVASYRVVPVKFVTCEPCTRWVIKMVGYSLIVCKKHGEREVVETRYYQCRRTKNRNGSSSSDDYDLGAHKYWHPDDIAECRKQASEAKKEDLLPER